MPFKKYFPVCIFLVITILFCLPILNNFQYWGQMDWDQFVFWNAVPRESFLTYNQFPLWNPYVNGGNPSLAHPDSPFLSPFFIFVLVLGPVIGLKVQIFVHLFLGLCGMYVFARFWGIRSKGAYLSAFLYMLSSVFALKMGEGQTEWFALAFVPWVFFYLFKGKHNKKMLFGAVIFLSLIILNGVYVFTILSIFLLIYLAFKSINTREFSLISNVIFVFAGVFLLCAVKLFPMIEFLKEHPREMIELDYSYFWKTPPSYLLKMLFSRQQVFYDIVQWKQVNVKNVFINGWHEYGAYVGLIPFLLFFVGVFSKLKSRWPLIVSGLLCLAIVLGSESPIDIWNAIRMIPLFRSLTVPSRFIFCFIFSFSLLAGFGFDCIDKKIDGFPNRLIKGLPVLLLAFVLVDLTLVNSPIFNNVFRVKPVEVERNDSFAQRFREYRAYDLSVGYSSIYPVFLSNSGILEGYEIIQIEKGNVSIESDPDYKGEIFLLDSRGEIVEKIFTPNRFQATVVSTGKDLLSLNQNYHSGWKARIDGKKVKVVDHEGLSSIEIKKKGVSEIEFYYFPDSFVWGTIISSLFFLYMVFCLTKEIILKKRCQ